MSENRKYYYMKLKENFFTDAKMVILESMQDGLLYSNLLLKMYLMSLKYNGILMLNDHCPIRLKPSPPLPAIKSARWNGRSKSFWSLVLWRY